MQTHISDGCTLWIDGIAGTNWRHCCEVHDAAYSSLANKLFADLDLARCVGESGAPIMAVVMFCGVTLFGWIWYARARHANRS
jgi:hypothetical protein|tara:strand:- start:37170 stop:37418 length:249 start_codon:yes stop_codon:yes gene_type:complete